MKKKTSLWISGITTVALLATAVGSFAAWDTLSKGTDSGLTVGVSDPVVLSVDNVAKAQDQLKVVPSGLASPDDIVDSTIRAQEVTVGTFDAALKNKDGIQNLKTTFETELTGTADASKYTVSLYDGNSPVTDGLTLTEAAKPFTVKIKANDGADITGDQNATLNVKVTLKTEKTIPAP